MTTLALLFMAASWSFVLGLTVWSFRRVLRSRSGARNRPQAGKMAPDQDGSGPAERLN